MPSLQQINRPQTVLPEDIVNGHDCYFCKDSAAIATAGFAPGKNPNTETLVQLFIGFFHFYAYGFNYHNDVICIRTGKILSKTVKGWAPFVKSEVPPSTAAVVVALNTEPPVAIVTAPAALVESSDSTTIANKPYSNVGRCFWCIEDPFELTHNLGRVLDRARYFYFIFFFFIAQVQIRSLILLSCFTIYV